MQRKWKRHWKRALAKIIIPPIVATGLILSVYGVSFANPEGGTVTAGSAAISSNGSTMTVTQTTNKVAINWQSFSIASGETVNFLQPGSSSIALNRVIGNDVSAIYGSLNANGQVFLINPNGVLFSSAGQVNVGGIVASTLNISNSDFMSGKYTFSGNSTASVINEGSITAASGGYVALLSADVENNGVIAAQAGTVALASGSAVTLDFSGDGLLNVAVDEAAVGASVTNRKLIQADGGTVIMTAKTAGDLTRTAVNNSGIILACTANNVNGVIRLDAGTNGAVVNSGTLDASGKSSGETGGTVKVLGKTVTLASGSSIDVSGDAAGGTALIGGAYQGEASETAATTTTVESGTTINADAITSGNGGQVVVWSDGATTFAGAITARGGSGSGDGGSVETSGKSTLKVADTASVITTAANGATGTWLLDPADFTIADSGGDMSTATLEAALANSNVTITTGSTSNTVTEGSTTASTTDTSGSSGSGDITVASAVNWNSAYGLTLSAYNDINVSTAITNSGSGAVNLTAGNDINVNAAITTAGAVTLKAGTDINVNSVITSTGSGDVILRADNDADDSGTVTFDATSGKVVTDGKVSIYYNPSGTTTTTINGTSTSVKNYLNSSSYTDYVTNTSGETGSLTAYMLVNNLTDLEAVNLNMYGTYALGCDIDASDTSTWNSGKGFTPISLSGGIFDGDGHTISGLYINSSGNLGLFSSVDSSATVRNLGLIDVDMTDSGGSVGGIAANVGGSSKITNCYVTGTVTGSGNVGGLVGYLDGSSYEDNSTISNSYSEAIVTGSGNVGGLVGYNCDYGRIVSSYNSGAVTGSGNVGGLIGYMDNGKIVSSYNSGAVTGSGNTGGLAGYSDCETISNSYNTGAVTGSGNSTGGLFGSAGPAVTDDGVYDGTITDCYNTGAVTSSSTYTGGLVGNEWGSIIGSYSSGTVTGSGTYTGGLVGYNSQYLDTNISDCYSTGAVTGTGDSSYVGGLIGYNRGTIKDSYSIGAVTATGNSSYVGGLVGYNVNGTITASFSTGAVSGTGTGAVVGGLVGQNTYSQTQYDDDGNPYTNTTTGTITSSYWATDTSGQSQGVGDMTNAASGVTGQTADQFMNKAFLKDTLGWDFDNTWIMVDGYTYPFLKWEYSTTITNAHQLQLMATDLDASYTLAANIDLTGYNMAKNGWLPIGTTSASAFTGSLDGNGYVISNLTTTGSSTTAAGLFGYVGSSGEVSDVGLYDVSINASSSSSYVGTLAGYNAGIITNAYSTGSVSGYGTVGGLVGDNSGTIKTSYTTTVVTVADSGYAGGLVGENDGTITEGYSSGAVSGATIGGLVGNAGSGSSITSSYWDTGTSGIGTTQGVGNVASASGVTGLTTDKAFSKSSYSGWDFSGTWYMVDGSTRPFLRSENVTTITNGHQLQLMAVNPSATYTMASAINLASELSAVSGMWRTSATADANGNYGFVPVGTSSDPFSGTLFGNGYTISGLTIYSTTAGADVGLFGYIQDGTVSYVGISNATITATGSGDYVGGLVGENDGGTISNASFSGTVTASGTAGGLAGANAGTISDSYNAGTVTASDTVGGVAGANTGTIKGSYNAGTVIANGDSEIVGGVAGKNTGTITGSYNASAGTVSVSGTGSSAGGVAGSNTSTGSIVYSYNAGTVTASGDSENVGGVAGTNTGTITSSYNIVTGNVTGTANATVGGVVGKNENSGSLTKCYNEAVLTVSGVGSTIGGVAGVNYGSIVSSYNDASVTVSGAGSTIGGVTGVNYGSITCSYTSASGAVESNADNNIVGGVAGENDGTIIGSYNNGDVITTATATNNKVGGLVGVNAAAGSITKSYTTGGTTVNGGDSYVGGLVGENAGSIVSSTNSGAVIANGSGSSVGGLAGVNNGSVTTSFGVGNVSGDYIVGGLVGTNAGSITDSYYAISTVEGTGTSEYVGGLAGVNSGTITTSYNSGAVTGAGTVGGLVGDGSTGTITASVWNTETSGQAAAVGNGLGTTTNVIGLNNAQMSDSANYPSGWDFTDTWTLSGTRPLLQWQTQATLTITNVSVIDAAEATSIANILNGGTNATLTTSASSSNDGDIDVDSAITWASGKTLTLSAYQDVNVNAAITSLSGGNVALRADNAATDTGTVTFGTGGKVVTDGTVAIYYNPSDLTSVTINGTNVIMKDYTNSTDYSAYVENTAGGTGNLTAYMLVNNVYELEAISLNTAGVYALGCDIDASVTRTWYDGEGFATIGTEVFGTESGSKFSGIFDGNGYVISSLYINDSTHSYVGLFGKVTGTIRNLGLVDVDITGGKDAEGYGGQYVGALAGYVSGTVTNCYVTGTVTGTNSSTYSSDVGGLVGYSEGTIADSYSTAAVKATGDQYAGGLVGYNNGEITDSYSSGAVTASDTLTSSYSNAGTGGLVGYNKGKITNSYSSSAVTASDTVTGEYSNDGTGGLVGYNDYGTITDCYSSGTVTSSATVTGSSSKADTGGLAGYNSGTIADSYSSGAVTASGSESYVGGLVGYNDWGTITACYSAGEVTGGSGTYAGGFVGGTDYADGITNCYWDSDSSGQTSGSGDGSSISGLTALSATGSDPYSESSYSGWDFDNTWIMVDGYTRPFLRWEYSTTITNAHQLQLMATDLDASYTLAANIDLTGYNMAKNGWLPIGTTSASAFTGSLDGNGYVISNLTTTGSSTPAAGLFGYVGSSGKVSDVGLYDVSINAGSSSSYVGSLAGYNAGKITNAYSTGSVSGYGAVGGLVGDNAGTIKTSYTTTAVTVDDSGYAGGLVGENDGTITECYSSGAVSGVTGSTLGGLVGYADSDSTITSSYWDTGTSGIGTTQGVGNVASASGVTGLTTDEAFDESSYSDWDFSGTWYMVDGYTRPFLRSENVTTITNAHQLQLMAVNPSATYILGSDIDLTSELSNASGMWRTSATADANGNYGFVPVGTSSDPFTGTLEGNRYTVSGLTINNTALTAVGLFGYIKDATIIDIILSNAAVTAGSGYAGGLVGENAGGRIIKASFSGTVTATSGMAGGLVGLNDGYILDGYNAGTVSVSGVGGSAGGVAGVSSGSIIDSYNAGTVTGSGDSEYVGGVAGVNSGTITVSYNAGTVSISGEGSSAGGVAGTSSGTISDSYNASTVTGSGDSEYVGGVAGTSSGTITDSYNANAGGTVSISGAGSSAGGVAGSNTGTITGSYNAAGEYALSDSTGYDSSVITVVAGAVSGSGTNEQVGGVAGYNAGTITDSYNGGTVSVTATASGSAVGGVAGVNAATGTISQSYNAEIKVLEIAASVSYGNTGASSAAYTAGTVTDSATNSYAGGLVGKNAGSITECYNWGPVTASGAGSYVGGLVGWNESGGSVSDAYSSVIMVTASGNSSYAGGLVGVNNGSIANTYAVSGMDASGTGSVAGGLVGLNNGTITSSYWNEDIAGVDSGVGYGSDSGTTSLTIAQMMQSSSYAGWDLTSTWSVENGYSFPYFAWQYSDYVWWNGNSWVQATPQFISGTVEGTGTGETVVINGSMTTKTVNGFYYMNAPAGNLLGDSAIAKIYVHGDSNYKANAWYRSSTYGVANANLIKDTLIDAVEGPYYDYFANAITYNAPTIPAEDSLYTYSNQALLVNGNLIINFSGGSDDVFVIDSPITATGDITITASNLLIDYSGAKAYSASSAAKGDNYDFGGGKLTAGGDITIVTDNFFNDVGTDAFQLTGNGRWLVYTSDPLLTQSDILFYFQPKYLINLIGEQSKWSNFFYYYTGATKDKIYDGRGGLTGDLALWGTAYGDAVPATGNGFVYSEANPVVQPLTTGQQQRATAITEAKLYNVAGQVVPTAESSLIVTISDGGELSAEVDNPEQDVPKGK